MYLYNPTVKRSILGLLDLQEEIRKNYFIAISIPEQIAKVAKITFHML